MLERTPPRVTLGTPIGDDADLAHEGVRLADGTRLTPEVAESIVGQARRAAGRPSLSGTAATSPQIAFRIASALRERAAEIAAQEGKTLSQLAREALEERIAHTRRFLGTGRTGDRQSAISRPGCGVGPHPPTLRGLESVVLQRGSCTVVDTLA